MKVKLYNSDNKIQIFYASNNNNKSNDGGKQQCQ